MKRLTPDDFKAMPWLNRGGMTQEIARESDDRGLLWRVSTARVETDCVYSLFPGLMRLSAVIKGNGIHLKTADETETLSIRPGEFGHLTGDTLYQGTLLDGGIRHLNLIFDPKRISAEMRFLETGETTLPSDATHLIYCCAGGVSGGGSKAISGEVLTTTAAAGVDVEADARAVLISVIPTKMQNGAPQSGRRSGAGFEGPKFVA